MALQRYQPGPPCEPALDPQQMRATARGDASRHCGTRPRGDADSRCPGHRAGWQQLDCPIGGRRARFALGCAVILDGMSEPDERDPGRPRTREWMRGSQGQARRLLMDWDPIGVSGISEAGNEYDCMIGPLLHRLYEGADTRSLADWISHERSSHFGLGPDGARDMQLAETADSMVGGAKAHDYLTAQARRAADSCVWPAAAAAQIYGPARQIAEVRVRPQAVGGAD